MFRALTVCLLLLSVVSHAQDGETIILTINGVEYVLPEGEELVLKENLSSPTISARVAATKKFETRYLSFDYPKNFSYSYEEDIGYRNWTLDGMDFVIMYFEMDVESGLKVFVEEMLNQFGPENCRTKPIQLKLGDRTLKGTRMNVTLVGQFLTIDFIEVESNAFKTRILTFQDSLDVDGNPSKEKEATMKVINNTIEFN